MTNIKNSTFCSHIAFIGFVWIWEQTTIISLFSINWVLFITYTECVYCAVLNCYLYIIQKINSFECLLTPDIFAGRTDESVILNPPTLYSSQQLNFHTATHNFCPITGENFLIGWPNLKPSRSVPLHAVSSVFIPNPKMHKYQNTAKHFPTVCNINQYCWKQ